MVTAAILHNISVRENVQLPEEEEACHADDEYTVADDDILIKGRMHHYKIIHNMFGYLFIFPISSGITCGNKHQAYLFTWSIYFVSLQT